MLNIRKWDVLSPQVSESAEDTSHADMRDKNTDSQDVEQVSSIVLS